MLSPGSLLSIASGVHVHRILFTQKATPKVTQAMGSKMGMPPLKRRTTKTQFSMAAYLTPTWNLGFVYTSFSLSCSASTVRERGVCGTVPWLTLQGEPHLACSKHVAPGTIDWSEQGLYHNGDDVGTKHENHHGHDNLWRHQGVPSRGEAIKVALVGEVEGRVHQKHV